MCILGKAKSKKPSVLRGAGTVARTKRASVKRKLSDGVKAPQKQSIAMTYVAENKQNPPQNPPQQSTRQQNVYNVYDEITEQAMYSKQEQPAEYNQYDQPAEYNYPYNQRADFNYPYSQPVYNQYDQPGPLYNLNK